MSDEDVKEVVQNYMVKIVSAELTNFILRQK